MEKMSKLVKDWFGRRADEAYTFADDRKRLFSWDKGRESYSSYFIRDDNAMKNAAKMIGSMFRVVGVPRGTTYTVNPKVSSTRPMVQVPIQMLRDEEGNFKDQDPQLLDAFYGAAIQNAAQMAMQTDSEYLKMQRIKTNKKATMSDVFGQILNTERVDKKLADRLPGYLKFVQRFKDHKFESYEGPGLEASKQERLMDLIMRMLRYPANLTEEELNEFEKPLKSIERLLKKTGGIPGTFEDCQSMGRSLANIVYKYVEEEEEQPEEEGGGGEGEGEDESSGKPSPSKSKSEMDDAARAMMEELMSTGTGDESDEELMDSFEDFTDEMEDDKEKKMEKEFNEEGEVNEGVNIFKRADTDKDSYKHSLKRIDVTKAAVLQKLFARKSKNYEFSIKSMRSGRLDTNKIAEARQNVPTIYERIGAVSTNKVTVGVLIDESGSMGGTKIQKAREAAIFINEVFKKMPEVNLYIYGFTSDTDGMDVNTIRIYHEKGTITDPFALGSVEARANNRDGEAILAVAKRMRSRTPDQGLLFVLSDGAPSAYNYGGRAGIEDTRKKVSKAQSMGFQVIQIAIEHHVPSKEMFDYYIQMTDIKNLPRDMVAYMSRKVDKLIKETVTL